MCVWECICSCVYIRRCICVYVHRYCSLKKGVHVHYIRQGVCGVPQRVCTAVCSELSAPAGCAIPIYPSATEVGGKSAGHRCRRFHIRGTRLPVRRPLCGSDEGGRLRGNSVGELGLLGTMEWWVRGGQHNSTPPWNPWALRFLRSIAAKQHICLTPGAAVWQSGAVCPDSHLFTLQFVLKI